MTPRTPLAPRVDTLEEKVAKLEKSTATLRKDQSVTRRLVRELKRQVDSILPGVDAKLTIQTEAINEHVDEQIAALRQSFFESLFDVAQQWPATALVTVTFVLAIIAAVAAAWILEATGHLHLG